MRTTLRQAVGESFTAGLLLTGPLIVTVILFRVLFGWMRGLVAPIVEGGRLAQYTANVEFAAQLLALVLVVVAIAFVGFLAQLSVGRRTFGSLGRVVTLIPLFRTVYGSLRQIATSLVERSTKYESVVYVEYPRLGVYSIGFVTGDSPESIEAVAGGPVYNVYVPASPNPTTGGLHLVPEENLHESDLSVREGIRLVMTTGVTSDPEEEATAVDRPLSDA